MLASPDDEIKQMPTAGVSMHPRVLVHSFVFAGDWKLDLTTQRDEELAVWAQITGAKFSQKFRPSHVVLASPNIKVTQNDDFVRIWNGP